MPTIILLETIKNSSLKYIWPLVDHKNNKGWVPSFSVLVQLSTNLTSLSSKCSEHTWVLNLKSPIGSLCPKTPYHVIIYAFLKFYAHPPMLLLQASGSLRITTNSRAECKRRLRSSLSLRYLRKPADICSVTFGSLREIVGTFSEIPVTRREKSHAFDSVKD